LKFDLFKPKMPNLIGVDVSASAVKMVLLSATAKNSYRLENYAVVTLSKDAVTEGNITGLEQVVDGMRSAWRMLGTREKNIAMSLPTAAVITKKVMMAADLREDEMEIQVESEANQYIPFPLDEVNIDFQVLGAAPKNSDDVEVLIAAAKKEKIDDRVAVAEEAGLKVHVMDVDAYATEAAYLLMTKQLPKEGKRATNMLIDIGANSMHINVFVDQQSVYIREQNFGGILLTQEIQRRFGLSTEESEIAKRKGGLPESYQEEVLTPYLASLVGEVDRAVSFFTTSSSYSQVDHIILVGGCAALPGIAEMVQQKTEVHTVIGNPFHQMSLSNKLKQKQLSADAPALVIACGLALRGVNND
jgi:type IV pilus assembly protein PilM